MASDASLPRRSVQLWVGLKNPEFWAGENLRRASFILGQHPRTGLLIDDEDVRLVRLGHAKFSWRPVRDAVLGARHADGGTTTSAFTTSAPTTTAIMGYQTPNIDRIAKEGGRQCSFAAHRHR